MTCYSPREGSLRCQAWQWPQQRWCRPRRVRKQRNRRSPQATGPIVQQGVSPRLTVHALDTYHGTPAAGLRMDFSKLEDKKYKLIRSVVANATGRSDEPLLIGDAYQAGDYELLLHLDDYFASKSAKLPTPPFLSKVPVRIRVVNIAERIHLPIQFAPWSYTYSRGS